MNLHCCNILNSSADTTTLAAHLKFKSEATYPVSTWGTESNPSTNLANTARVGADDFTPMMLEHLKFSLNTSHCSDCFMYMTQKSLCIYKAHASSQELTNCLGHRCEHAQRQNCHSQPSLLTPPFPSHPWKSLGWITPHQPPVINMDIPSWLSYHLVYQILGK